MSPTLSNAHIIVVDDESINLTIMEISLQERDYKVTCFQSAEKCLKAIEGYSLKNYDCLITDYSMAGMSGIQLLERIKALDPTLEVIVVTGENERKIIQESLRRGAYDFLDKPLNLEKFYNSVERAITATSARRKREATEASLLAARSTGMFNKIETDNWKTKLDLVYAPKHELGGDFIDVFETENNQKFAIFGDVSGHDIQAALLSSHYLGTLEGRRSIEQSLNMHALFKHYNQCLIGRREALEKSENLRMGSSLSLCSMELTYNEDCIKITNCGVPPVYIIHYDNSVSRIKPQSHPLGWFDELELHEESITTANIQRIYGFTDGLIEFGMKHHWDILSLLYYLKQLNKSDQQAFLVNAEDDILLAHMEFGKQTMPDYPIVFDEYRGNDASKIDRYQNIWKQSLKLVTPEADPKKINRFVLACREAVLNALNHGCNKDHTKVTSFLIRYNPTSQVLLAIVQDPGNGHDFDFNERQKQLKDLTPGHLGLVLISKLVDEMKLENGGSTLRMKMNI